MTPRHSQVLWREEWVDTLRGENCVRFTKCLFQSVGVVHEVLFAPLEGVRLFSIRQIAANSIRKLTWVRYLRGLLANVISLLTSPLTLDRNEKEKFHWDIYVRSLLLCNLSTAHPWNTLPWSGDTLHKI